MSVSKLFSRALKNSQISVEQGQTRAVFDANGVAEREATSATLLAQFPDLAELGRIKILQSRGFAGNATFTSTVPTGKYWRPLAAVLQIITDASVGDRVLTVQTRTAADAVIEAFAQAAQAASGTQKSTVLFAPNADGEGSRGVAAAGTITIAEPVTADDTIEVAGVVYTFVTTDDGTVANRIPLGGSEAATKVNIVTALKTNPLVTVPAAFTGDNLVVTAAQKGVAGDSLTFVENLTHVSNVLDGSGTLGGTTAGVDFAEKVSAAAFPAAGSLLTPGEDIHVLVATTADLGDVVDAHIVVLEFDADPR